MAIRRNFLVRFHSQQRTLQIGALAATVAIATVCIIPGKAGAGDTPASLPVATASQAEAFEKKIRPLLVSQCLPCHNSGTQSGGVRLDTPQGVAKTIALTEKGADPDKSPLIQVVRYDGKIKMPPDHKLPAADIALLTEWVKSGAPWPASAAASSPMKTVQKGPLWSFQPVRKVTPPNVKNAVWATSPADLFILAKLESKNLTPAPATGKRTLIRRAYFDLVGLPPTPAQIEAFVADKSPDAFAKVVDSLLASPHYGERWARHWLDVARYADSNGLDENLAFGNAWRYRDWVVSALNKDKPYDSFLQEQIAGDLMDSGGDEELHNERITATGFLTLGAKVLAEQDKPKLVMDIVDEQIDVTSKVTMGLTVACARCHDHKFDPISTKDYYALAGIFKSAKTMKDLGFVSRVNVRTLSTKKLTGEQKGYEESLKPLEAALAKAQSDAKAEIAAPLRRDADKYIRAGAELSRQPGILLTVGEASLRPGSGEKRVINAVSYVRGNATRDNDNYGKGIGGVLITNQAPVNAEWDIDLSNAGRYQVELRYAAEDSRPIRLWINGKLVNEKAAASVTGSWIPEGQRWEAQGIYEFAAGKNVVKIERIDGPLPHIHKLQIFAALPTPAPANGAKPLTAEDIAKRDNLNAEVVTRFAVRLNSIPDPQTEREKLLADAALFAVPAKPETLYSETAKNTIKKAQDTLEAARKKAPMTPVVMAMEEQMKPEDVRIHLRGSTLNLGDVAPRGFPAQLVKVCSPDAATPVTDKDSGRLALARWLTRPEHPLTSRVAVNRIWQHLFGMGLVATSDNWGVRGEKPSHPELLDYLASTFVKEDKWSQKKLIRRLMLSSTYRMSVVAAPAVAAKANVFDPENRLLWRMNRRRLEAEPLRDAMLAVSGQLDKTLGGTLLPTNDNDYVTNDQSGNQAVYAAPRRSLYLPVIRNAIYPLFQSFDFGDGTTVNARRASTTVAPQALILLNSPLTLETSRAFASTLPLDAPVTDAVRIRQAIYRALGRPATEDDLWNAAVYLNRYEQAVAPLEPDPAKRRIRAYQSYCQALFASNEFIFVD